MRRRTRNTGSFIEQDRYPRVYNFLAKIPERHCGDMHPVAFGNASAIVDYGLCPRRRRTRRLARMVLFTQDGTANLATKPNALQTQ